MLALVASWPFLLACHGAPDPTAPRVLSAERLLMGTLWSIRVVVPPDRPIDEARDTIEAAFDEVARIESLLSEYRPDSALSRLNASAGGDPIPVPQELRDLIVRSIGYGRQSQGAFDITWRGLAPLWHFGDEPFGVPSPGEVELARQAVDYRRIVIEDDWVGLPDSRMAIGLGGVAKGYAIDQAAGVLAEAGIERFLVDGGGDVRVRGEGPDGPWRIGINDPRSGASQAPVVLRLDAGSAVTSGDYERFREVGGVRYHHIIDPRTGWPARASISVTVVCDSAELADALATAAFVLGHEAGRSLIETNRCQALWLDPEGRISSTPGFLRLLKWP